MSARLTKVDFEAGDDFELFPAFEKGELEGRFTGLKQTLLGELLEETETLSLRPRFERAANEAAGLAWTTGYPLLVFPGLFDELARQERTRENRQQQIKVRTEMLLETV